MKKFMVFLLAIVGVVSIGFSAYFLTKDNENFVLRDPVKYVRVGDTFDIDFTYENKKATSTYEIIITDPTVVKLSETEPGRFVALNGGISTVTFRTSNPRFRNVASQIFVGDGSSAATPFYISTEEELRSIGDESIPNNPFTLDSYYKLVNNIKLNDNITADTAIEDTYFTPIGAGTINGFVGGFDGNGYTISGLKLNPEYYQDDFGTNNIGLFEKVGAEGNVRNLKLENVVIEADYATYVGAVAAINLGTVERIELTNVVINTPNAFAVGGAIGMMESFEEGSVADDTYTRRIARADRIGINNLQAGFKNVNGQITANGVGGNVGGIVGENLGGIIIYSYVTGEVFLNNDTLSYGGVLGFGRYLSFSTTANNKYSLNQGAVIKDTYASIYLKIQNAIETELNLKIGGLVGRLIDTYLEPVTQSSSVNRLIGNYYDSTKINADEQIVNGGQGEIIGGKYFNFGVGYYELDNVETQYLNQDYKVMDKTTSQLRTQSTYISHVNTELVFVGTDADGKGGTQQTRTKQIPWKFGTVWNINQDVNFGLPYLSYDTIELADEIVNVADSKVIRTPDELQNITLDGHYVIAANLDLGKAWYENNFGEGTWKPWTPIGTPNSPFYGSLHAATYIDGDGNEQYYTIFNLTLDGEQATSNLYGGLFGATSNKLGGEIKNLRIVEPVVSGYVNASVLVGTNGLPNDKAGKEKGMTIKNVGIYGASVSGTSNVGAVAAINHEGIIEDIIIDDYRDKDTGNVITTSSITLIPGADESRIGGIVAYNNGTVNRVEVVGSTEIKAKDAENLKVYIGGIAGINNRIITQAFVNAGGRISTELGIGGAAGGIAGINYGDIADSIVKLTGISIDEKQFEGYAGGIAGRLLSNGTIYRTLVSESTVDGKVVGGTVGEHTFSDSDFKFTFTFSENGNINANKNIFKPGKSYTIYETGVEDAAIRGDVVGGIVGILRNGIVSDSYFTGSISGVSTTSIKAGIVGEIEYKKEGNIITAGVMQRVYTSVKFNADGQGKEYAVSKSEFLQEPLIKNIPFTELEITRPAGFITNYVFDDDIDGDAQHPNSGNFLSDAWKWITQQGWLSAIVEPILTGNTKHADMVSTQAASLFRKYTFSTTQWTFENKFDGEGKEVETTPRLISLVNLEKSINKFEVSYRFSNRYLVIPVDESIQVIDKTEINVVKERTFLINKFDQFEFSVESIPNFEIVSITVTVDGQVINAVNGVYKLDKISKHTFIDILAIVQPVNS